MFYSIALAVSANPVRTAERVHDQGSAAAVMLKATAWKLPEVESPKRMRLHFRHRAQL
jgi:hypothetical protein